MFSIKFTEFPHKVETIQNHTGKDKPSSHRPASHRPIKVVADGALGITRIIIYYNI